MSKGGGKHNQERLAREAADRDLRELAIIDLSIREEIDHDEATKKFDELSDAERNELLGYVAPPNRKARKAKEHDAIPMDRFVNRIAYQAIRDYKRVQRRRKKNKVAGRSRAKNRAA